MTTNLITSINLQQISSKDFHIGIEPIGHGGYGDVYAGRWHGIEVAIKKLYLKTLSKELTQDFENEAKIMAQCQFPHIVRLYGVCLETGNYAMVMEYAHKGSLYNVLRNGNEVLPWNPIRWQISIDMAKGLNYLHAHNIVHRDLKSLNVLLDENYCAKISDFGLSKIKLESNSTSTKTKNVMGTTRWRAPELFKRGVTPSKASDIYSYGMVMWEITSRQLPYSDALDDQTAISWIKDGEKENIPADCPPDYGKIIQDCWRAPEGRPSADKILSVLIQAKPNPIVPKPKSEPEVYTEKAWHFDIETKKAVVLKDKDYELISATPKDRKKVVEFYMRHPVSGYEVGNVTVIYNPKFNRGFELHMHKLQNRHNNPAFEPKWLMMNNPAFRQETYELYKNMAQPYQDSDYPAVKIFPAFHGTSLAILDSIFRTGYANLATTDNGFFGKGYYSAYEAEYSYRAYAKGALILNWVVSFSALPVIDGDMALLEGKGNYGNYDAHFVPVFPRNPNNPDETVYFPCKTGQRHQYTEIVVFESAACLPRYFVELQANLLPSPKPVSPSTEPVVQTPLKRAAVPSDVPSQAMPENQSNYPPTFQEKTLKTEKPEAPLKDQPKPKLVLNPQQQEEKQNQLMKALLKGDLEKAEKLELQGSSFLYPNKNGLYPLAAAVYSLSLELVIYVEQKLKDEASKQWAEVDINIAIENLYFQTPTTLSSDATYREICSWYKQYATATWGQEYDKLCLMIEDCENWENKDWKIRAKCLIAAMGEGYRPNKKAVIRTGLFLPSVQVHQKVVEAILENLEEFRKYLEIRVKQPNKLSQIGQFSISNQDNKLPKPVFASLIQREKQKKQQNELINALLKGDIESVKKLESQGASFLYPNTDGLFPLVSAVYSTNLELVRYLEEKLECESSKQWLKVDVGKAFANIDNQLPTALPNKANFFIELSSWYGRNDGKRWCVAYDKWILEMHECTMWKNERWNIRAEQHFTAVNDWTPVTEKNLIQKRLHRVLIVPSRVVHEFVLKTISESLNELKKDVETKSSRNQQIGILLKGDLEEVKKLDSQETQNGVSYIDGLSSHATYGELGKWYNTYKDEKWKETYDKNCLELENCQEWVDEDWTSREEIYRLSHKDQQKMNSVIKLTDKYRKGVVVLYSPSRVTHETVVSDICQMMAIDRILEDDYCSYIIMDKSKLQNLTLDDILG